MTNTRVIHGRMLFAIQYPYVVSTQPSTVTCTPPDKNTPNFNPFSVTSQTRVCRKKCTAQTKDVDKQLEDLALADEYHFKVLLLGAGESGKSTVVKQVKKKASSFFPGGVGGRLWGYFQLQCPLTVGRPCGMVD